MDFKVKCTKMEYFGELENGTFFLYNDELYFKTCLEAGLDNTNAVRLTRGIRCIFDGDELIYPLALNGDFSVILE